MTNEINQTALAESYRELPLPLQALGLCAFDGSRQFRNLRIEKICSTAEGTPDAYLLDSYRLFIHGKALGLSDLPNWYQVPYQISASQPFALLQKYCAQSMQSTPAQLIFLPEKEKLDLGAGFVNALDDSTLAQLEQVEILLNEDRWDKAFDYWQSSQLHACKHPRVEFLQGVVCFKQGNFATAARHFQSAYQLGHPDGHLAELEMLKLIGQGMHKQHPALCKNFYDRDYAKALNDLQNIPDDFLQQKLALMAYCCRHTLQYEKGLEICKQAISAEDSKHSDIFSHKWVFETQLGLDQQASQTALQHLQRYPIQASAFVDALHSSLLLGNLKEAKFFAYGYLIHAQNLNLALKQLFIYYEHSTDFSEALLVFQALFPKLRSPTPESLMRYAEILLECNQAEQSFPLLERALAAAPESAEVVLCYGRALARSNLMQQAIKFMESVVHDQNRQDSTPERFLFITLLSELYRNADQLSSALALWPGSENFNAPLLEAIGPRAFAEYCYCLAEQGADTDAERILSLLLAEYPNEPVVLKLRETLLVLSTESSLN